MFSRPFDALRARMLFAIPRVWGRKGQKTERFVKTLTDRELQRIRVKSGSVKKHNRPTYA